MFGFGRASKPKASVFVDYEHWYYGYHNNFHMKPNFEEWLQELQNEYAVNELFVFGDFSQNSISSELSVLQGLTKDVIHTASDKQGVDKDFTDVIILDAIYRSAAKKKSSDVYILFTGKNYYNDLILASLNKLRSKQGKMPSYWMTISNVSKYNKVPEERIRKALDGLINQKYIDTSMRTNKKGTRILMLNVHWDKLEEDGLWR